MLCLLCAEEISEDLKSSTNTYEQEVSTLLCDLLELRPEEYLDILRLVRYCHDCQQLLHKVNSSTCTRETYERQKSIINKTLISSWMKLQCEDRQAANYCPWQSVRLKILLDIGAVMEVMEYHASEQTESVHGQSSVLTEYCAERCNQYRWHEDIEIHGRKDNILTAESPTQNQATKESPFYEVVNSKDICTKEETNLLPVVKVESNLPEEICRVEKHSISTSEDSSESRTSNTCGNTTLNLPDGERVRKSRRKPLKPIKGIYQLQPQNRVEIEPFGSRLHTVLSLGVRSEASKPKFQKPLSTQVEAPESRSDDVNEDHDVKVEIKEEKPTVETESKPSAALPLQPTSIQQHYLGSMEEIEAAVVLNIMKHAKEPGRLVRETGARKTSKRRRSQQSRASSKEVDSVVLMGNSVKSRGEDASCVSTPVKQRRRSSFSPDITAERPKKVKKPLVQKNGSSAEGICNSAAAAANLPKEVVKITEEQDEKKMAVMNLPLSPSKGKNEGTQRASMKTQEPLKTSVSDNHQEIPGNSPEAGIAKFKCEYENCERMFTSGERRDNHHKRHHEGIRNLYSCHLCGKSFPARSRLTTHMERHEQEGKTFPCSDCGKLFGTQKKLDFHRFQHSQNWGLYCDVCGKGFPPGQEMRLANHRKIHDESRPRPFKCEECGRTFSSQQYLNIHTKNHPITPDDDGLYRCPFESCQQTFKAVTSYREHTKIHTGELPFECKVCGKKFGYITGYKKHMISHTDEKHHTCHICGKQFKQKGNLNLHVSRHAGVKPFKCSHPGCDYSFFDQYKLKNHLDVHTGRRSFKCEDCGKYFRTSTGLKSHRNAVHAKERRYKCHCGKAFSQKQYLQFHKTQHPELNLKRFTCDVCSKKFSEPSSLREHKRRFHTGETAFQCDKCTYTACFKSRMEKHLLTHRNPELKCSSCDKLFRHQNNLQRHIANIHIKNDSEDAAQA